MPTNDEPLQEKGGDDGPNPAWADGLKQLYDAVVDEPLPDSFKDLLAQFDDEDSEDGSPEGGDEGS